MVSQLVGALILGLIGGFIPGPVVAAIFTEIMQASVLKSFRIIFWSILTEIVVALTSLILLSSLHLHEDFYRGISFIGAGVLIYIATSIWKIDKIDTEKKVHFSLPTISLMILTNGVLWAYWATFCIPKAIILGEKVILGQYLFIGLVEIGWLISTVAVALVFSLFRKLLSNQKVISIMFKIFALAFVYFALNMIYQSLRYFLK
ncbi:MAG: hypothetical protein WCO23_02525 [bacterium]